MSEKIESELREILAVLNGEKNKIKELNAMINEKVNQFHASDTLSNASENQPSQPGIIGSFRDLINELISQRELMEQILKELTTIVG